MKKKTSNLPEKDKLRPQYEASLIRGGVRGKYAEAFRNGTNFILLAPDVAAAFPDAESVNEALRLLMNVAKTALPKKKMKAKSH
jgi:hypothetical protein